MRLACCRRVTAIGVGQPKPSATDRV